MPIGTGPDDRVGKRDFGTAYSDFGYGLAANSTGVYVTGYTLGSLDGPNKGSYDGFVRKYNGGLIWAQQFGTRSLDYATRVAVDSTGASYVGGYTAGALGFKVGSYDGFVRKYSSDGALQWTRQFGTTGFDIVYDVAVDASNNVFVLSQDNYAGFTVRKFNSSGTLLANRTINTLPSLAPSSLAVDSAGNVIVLTVWYGGATSLNNTRVFKLTNALADSLQFAYSNNDNESAFDVTTIGTDIYITMRFNTATAGFGAELVKFNSAGTAQWARQLEPTSTCNCTGPNSVTADATGVYVTGYTTGAFSGFSNAGGYDLVVLKVNPAGTRLWTRQFGTSLNDYSQAVAVSDAVYVTGYTYGNLLGDAKYGSLDTDAFLAQIDKNTGAVLGIDQ